MSHHQESSPLKDWFQQHGITEVESLVTDLTGILKGKIMPASKYLNGGRPRLPDSIFIQTVTGGYPDDEDIRFWNPWIASPTGVKNGVGNGSEITDSLRIAHCLRCCPGRESKSCYACCLFLKLPRRAFRNGKSSSQVLQDAPRATTPLHCPSVLASPPPCIAQPTSD